MLKNNPKIAPILGPILDHMLGLILDPIVPHWSQKINSRFGRSTIPSASDFIKRLKNVKLSSKSGFSPQELQNLSRDTHMKRINPQQLPNLTQDTNMKRLNYMKLSS